MVVHFHPNSKSEKKKQTREKKKMELGKFQTSMDEEFEFLEIEDEELLGLSHWELIDASDADSGETHHRQSDSERHHDDKDGSDDGSVVSESPPVTDPVRPDRARPVRVIDLDLGFKFRGDLGGGEEDDGDDEDDDLNGLDDELVPWSVGDKLGRQRMRKLGKRTSPKMTNSKRSPYMVARPGCVRGKHGLGLKHIY